MDHPLYKLFSDRVFIHYQNGTIIKKRDISIDDLYVELNEYKAHMCITDFQKILTICLYNLATNINSDEVVDVLLKYITMNENQLSIRYRHPLLHEMCHQVGLCIGGSFNVFKKIVTHPVYNMILHDIAYTDTYGFTFKERLAIEMHNYKFSRKDDMHDFINWINTHLNVKAVLNSEKLKRPTLEEYTFDINNID